MKCKISAVSNIGMCIFEMFMPKDRRLHNLDLLTVRALKVYQNTTFWNAFES